MVSMSIFLKHNINILFSCNTEQLEVNNGVLDIKISGFGISSKPKKITLINTSEQKVRSCIVETLKNVAERSDPDTSVISHIDINPGINFLSKKVRNVLEILFLNGLTPYTFNEVNMLLDKAEIDSIHNAPFLKKQLHLLKAKLSNFCDLEVELLKKKTDILITHYFVNHPDFHQLDLQGWIFICQQMREMALDNEELSEISIALRPWEDINCRIAPYINHDSIRSLMKDPTCREITLRDLAKRLTKVFDKNHINMSENFPELYYAIQEWIPS